MTKQTAHSTEKEAERQLKRSQFCPLTFEVVWTDVVAKATIAPGRWALYHQWGQQTVLSLTVEIRVQLRQQPSGLWSTGRTPNHSLHLTCACHWLLLWRLGPLWQSKRWARQNPSVSSGFFWWAHRAPRYLFYICKSIGLKKGEDYWLS